MEKIVENIKKRYNKAKGGAETFFSMYKRAYELCAPNYNNTQPGAFHGQTGQPNVYDSTVSRAADAFVNTFVSTICPPQTRWMELSPSDELVEYLAKQSTNTWDMMSEAEQKQIIQEIDEKLTAEYQKITDKFFSALNQSNFYSVIDQFAHDIFVGMGCLLVQHGGDYFDSASPLDFTAIPPLDIAVELSPQQKITAVFRKQKLRYSQIEYTFPGFDYSVLNSDNNAEMDCEIEVLEACVIDPQFIKAENGMTRFVRWHYMVIYNDQIAFETRLEENPFVVFFWSLRQGENVGRGLLTKLLPDAEELEGLTKLKQQWLQLYGMGPYTVVVSKLINPAMVKIRPNSVIPVQEQGAIQPLQPAGNPQIEQMHIQELQQAIKETALDFTIPNDPRMTATQVQYIAQRQLQIFAGVVGRIQFQFLWKIIQNCLDILIKVGSIELPPELSKIDPRTTTLKILSPIGRVQFMNDLNSLTTALGTIAQIDPSLIQQYVRTEDLPTYIFEQTGSPAKLLRSKEETEQVQQQMQQQQAAMMMAQAK